MKYNEKSPTGPIPFT